MLPTRERPGTLGRNRKDVASLRVRPTPGPDVGGRACPRVEPGDSVRCRARPAADCNGIASRLTMRPQDDQGGPRIASQAASPYESHPVPCGLQLQVRVSDPRDAPQCVHGPDGQSVARRHHAHNPFGRDQPGDDQLVVQPNRRDRGRKHGRREKHRRRCNARLLRRQIAPRGLGPGILRDHAALRSARTGAAGPKQQQERHRPNEPGHAARTISERPPSCAE